MENWEQVKGYEGIYEVSDLGNVKSLNYNKTKKEKQLNKYLEKNEYYSVCLSFMGKYKTRTVHQLVAESFLNHNPSMFKLVVNHINGIKTDNRVKNLEIITARENTNKKHLKSTSKHTGVSWYKNYKKWLATIHIKGKKVFLGY